MHSKGKSELFNELENNAKQGDENAMIKCGDMLLKEMEFQ